MGMRFFLVALGLAVPVALAAQGVLTGEIVGRVVDQQGKAAPGVEITVRTGQGVRRLTSDDAGRFLFPHLTPGAVTLRAQAEGFPLIDQQVVVHGGRRTEVVVVLASTTFAEHLEVHASSPIVDPSVASGGAILSGETLARIPVGRRLGAVMDLVAGVSSGGGTGSGNPSISGASGLENQYLVDGIRINDPRFGGLGLFSTRFGAIGLGVTTDFVEQVQVGTSGSGAEASQSTGGIVSVITRSGSNRWQRSLFAYAHPRQAEGRREAPELAVGSGLTRGVATFETGFTAAGPLRRERVFLFLAASPQWEYTRLEAPSQRPLAALGPIDRRRSTNAYAGKVTVLLDQSHRLDLSAFGDAARSPNGPQDAPALLYRDTTAFSSLRWGTHTQSIRHSGVVSPKWLVESSVGRSRMKLQEIPAVDEWQFVDETTSPTSYSGGKGAFDPSDTGETLQAHWQSSHFLGSHELRWGASWDRVDYENTRGETGPRFTLVDGRLTGTGGRVTVLPDPEWGRVYRVTRARLDNVRPTSQQSWGVFLQDRVMFGSRLVVMPGVRWENQRLEGAHDGYTFANNWAPRLAATWDPSGKGRTKIGLSAGVFHARIPADLAVSAFNRSVRLLRADYFDAGLTRPIPDGVPAAGTTTHFLAEGSDTTPVLPGTRPTTSREASLGFEWEAAPRFLLSVRGVFRDLPWVLEDIGQAAMIRYFSGDPRIREVSYVLGNPRDGFPATVDGIGAFERPIRRYRALELTADRRLSDRWVFFGSYRWSRLSGTYEGFHNNDTDQSRPGRSSLYDFPVNDPSFTQVGGPQFGFQGDIRYLGRMGAGPLPNDCPHQFKAFGSYRLDMGLTVAAGFAVSSGRPLTPMATDPVLNRQGYIPEAPRGTGILTEDGFRRRTPTVWTADLHLSYTLGAGAGRLVILADAFNLLNRQAVISYDQNRHRSFGVANPDYGRATAYQTPRQIRLGVRYEL